MWSLSFPLVPPCRLRPFLPEDSLTSSCSYPFACLWSGRSGIQIIGEVGMVSVSL